MGGPRLVNCPAAVDKVLKQLFLGFASDIRSNKYIEISETTIGCLCCCVFPISHFGICYETADKYKDQNEENNRMSWAIKKISFLDVLSQSMFLILVR